jgi:hypothetical protein
MRLDEIEERQPTVSRIQALEDGREEPVVVLAPIALPDGPCAQRAGRDARGFGGLREGIPRRVTRISTAIEVDFACDRCRLDDLALPLFV